MADIRVRDSRKTVLDTINVIGRPVTAEEIVDNTDLSYSTVYRRLRELVENDVLSTSRPPTPGKGRPPVKYERKVISGD